MSIDETTILYLPFEVRKISKLSLKNKHDFKLLVMMKAKFINF